LFSGPLLKEHLAKPVRSLVVAASVKGATEIAEKIRGSLPHGGDFTPTGGFTDTLLEEGFRKFLDQTS
jgi:hypothetical protein